MRTLAQLVLAQPFLRVATMWLVAVGLAHSATAEIVPVNPLAPPVVTLPTAEATKLRALLGTTFPNVLSDISPDDRTVVITAAPLGPVFLDLETRATVPLPAAGLRYLRLSELRWRDPDTLVFIGLDTTIGAISLVAIRRDSGAVDAQPINLTSFPVSLSPNGQRLLTARVVGPPPPSNAAAASASAPAEMPASPFIERPLAAFRRPGPATFDRDERLTAQVTTTSVEFATVELASMATRVLVQVGVDTGFLNPAWSRDATKLALTFWQPPDNRRGGIVPTESDSVQDGLGRLPPKKNPLFTSNVLHLFSFDERQISRTSLRPTIRDGQLFAGVSWSPDARRFLVEMWEPSFLEGRPYPIYGSPQRSTLRVYSSQGHQLATLARPEVSVPTNMFFAANDEVIVSAVWGSSFHLYSYSLSSRVFRRLPTEAGAIYQVRVAPRSGDLIFNFSSFQQPYELYRISTKAATPRALTNLNAVAAALNQIRVDPVRFRVGRGDHDGRRGHDRGRIRTGYLLQPKGASFPPKHVPLVVWQQGGPTASMTAEWGSFVEQPFNLLPNFGFALLVVPLPGRLGFGADFLNALSDHENFGQIDIDEQAEIARQLVDAGFTLPSRLGITGCSYGGYFASQSVTRYPGLYAAANPQCSLLDLVHEFEQGYKPVMSQLMGRTPTDDPTEYARDSPVANAARVKAPTLIFAGVRDFLPYEISQRFHDAINAAGTLADFYVFDREGHGLAFPNSQFVAGQAQIEWFRNHLGHD